MPITPPHRPQRISSRNAAFQHWETLLRNRTKRHRAGEFVVQGVRPITLAVDGGWTITTLIRPERSTPSNWAAAIWTGTPCQHVEMPAELVAELAETADDAPELVAVVAMPPDDLDRLTELSAAGASPTVPLITVFDRPSQPGNIGTLMRSIDAFGGTGLVVTGHAADPYDPRTVRASTGSLFAVPTVRVPSPAEVIEWVAAQAHLGNSLTVLGTDEGGESDLRAVDLTGPTLLVIGNEARGLTRAWRDSCSSIVSIAMTGTASSLNAATAGSIVLYEAMRQRSSAS